MDTKRLRENLEKIKKEHWQVDLYHLYHELSSYIFDQREEEKIERFYCKVNRDDLKASMISQLKERSILYVYYAKDEKFRYYHECFYSMFNRHSSHNYYYQAILCDFLVLVLSDSLDDKVKILDRVISLKKKLILENYKNHYLKIDRYLRYYWQDLEKTHTLYELAESAKENHCKMLMREFELETYLKEKNIETYNIQARSIK